MNHSEKDPCLALIEKLAQQQVPVLASSAAQTLENFVEQAREILRAYGRRVVTHFEFSSPIISSSDQT